MKFGPIPIAEAEGAVLAHTVRLKTGAMKKGLRIEAGHIERLRDEGIDVVTAAQFDAYDVAEDVAAESVATHIAGHQVRCAEAFTGRVNLYAEKAGLLSFDRELLIKLNLIDEGLTVAALPPNTRVEPGRMIATVKIIPFALPQAVLDQAIDLLGAQNEALLSIAPFKPKRAALILTDIPGGKASLIKKREAVTKQRLESLGGELAYTLVVDHDEKPVFEAVADCAARNLDPILIFGGSAISDRKDVIPSALEQAGGTVHHLGMPVDPGNLLMLGSIQNQTVIGVPSCASSPKLNGLDWVLERCAAEVETTSADIAAMAPGGLLMEISTRPQPRGGEQPVSLHGTPKLAAIILAGGRSTRMGTANKLLERVGDKPMVRHVVEMALASAADQVIVVTGNDKERVREAIADLDVSFAHNEHYADGLSTSLVTGINALSPETDGAIIMLGDMPLVTTETLDKLIAAFAPQENRSICVPTQKGKRGNPILWSAEFFSDMRAIKGDTGAKHLLGQNDEVAVDVEIGDESIFADIDTPEALRKLRSTQESC